VAWEAADTKPYEITVSGEGVIRYLMYLLLLVVDFM
jgi:hypothetical protein